ncbi:PREDICTED: basic leucine zipper 43-like [Camelina sativa]|uniref:Basic leucine zipper 43-like n=1 Tax=Camelina sativa TaxID=90675 RepID=A0ABM0Y5Z2_CAMSA|nr:PREDICTED: basic leucine zipper 43-like [Camelina sativa]
MQPQTDVFNLHNYLNSSIPSPYPSSVTISTPFPSNCQNSNPLYGFQISTNNPQSMSLSSNNSTSDEAEEHQTNNNIINERKQRRMISNRESARRSRMRKQRHLDELWSQVMWLRIENHQLLDKLNNLSESYEKVLQENAQLKEETSELKEVISNMQIQSPFSCFRDDIIPIE